MQFEDTSKHLIIIFTVFSQSQIQKSQQLFLTHYLQDIFQNTTYLKRFNGRYYCKNFFKTIYHCCIPLVGIVQYRLKNVKSMQWWTCYQGTQRTIPFLLLLFYEGLHLSRYSIFARRLHFFNLSKQSTIMQCLHGQCPK